MFSGLFFESVRYELRHLIVEVLPNSIADELEIVPGDILLRINGREMQDVLDYQFTVQAEELLVEVEKSDGEIWELEIEKDAEEDLGLVFELPLMSQKRRCCNKCVFCFVDQQPPGLRPSLYFKDDDARLSFLHGNYVTLTNLSDGEIRRLAGYHLSPLRISVHAADLHLREKMMGNKNAHNLFSALEIFASAGIKMHFQVVLCKGINDGDSLSHTISALAALAESLAIVPAGLTRHRQGLHPLAQFSPQEARQLLAQLQTFGEGFVFAADEWYIMAGLDLPPYEYYAEFPQLDNGVGMIRLFENEFNNEFAGALPPHPYPLFEKSGAKTLTLGIITGCAAEEFMRGLAAKFEGAYPNVKINVYAVVNNFFGENITVSGLLTGADIIAQLQGRINEDVLFMPENAFRDGTDLLLDDISLSQLSAALGAPVQIGSSHGGEFFHQIIATLKFGSRLFKGGRGAGQSPATSP
jgi:putative radical SAM enzyme (TIGR03279 family)